MSMGPHSFISGGSSSSSSSSSSRTSIARSMQQGQCSGSSGRAETLRQMTAGHGIMAEEKVGGD
jgi:hypothetical protein